MECRLSTKVGHIKIKNGHNTYPSISRLGKYIACACRCIIHSTWRNFDTMKSRGLGPSYSLCKKEGVRILVELQHHRKRRPSHGIFTS